MPDSHGSKWVLCGGENCHRFIRETATGPGLCDACWKRKNPDFVYDPGDEGEEEASTTPDVRQTFFDFFQRKDEMNSDLEARRARFDEARAEARATVAAVLDPSLAELRQFYETAAGMFASLAEGNIYTRRPSFGLQPQDGRPLGCLGGLASAASIAQGASKAATEHDGIPVHDLAEHRRGEAST